VRHPLPGNGAASCFSTLGFNPACAQPETLDERDFVRAGSFLAVGGLALALAAVWEPLRTPAQIRFRQSSTPRSACRRAYTKRRIATSQIRAVKTAAAGPMKAAPSVRTKL
jgi:hypothetical protein